VSIPRPNVVFANLSERQIEACGSKIQKEEVYLIFWKELFSSG